jgi:hypothetical protein
MTADETRRPAGRGMGHDGSRDPKRYPNLASRLLITRQPVGQWRHD